MRLFLASSRPRTAPDDLIELVGTGAGVAVVANAVDRTPELSRRHWVEDEHAMLAAGGLHPVELDLRHYYYGPTSDLRHALARIDMVWVAGGNAFVLRDALRRSGLDGLLAERIPESSLVYGGYSAGACVCAPTLRGIELVDDPSVVKCPRWDGLGFIGFSIAPHYRSAYPDPQAIDRLVAYLRQHEMPYRALTDGEALVIKEGCLKQVTV